MARTVDGQLRFDIGDVVMLASGGCRMSVCSVEFPSGSRAIPSRDPNVYDITCQWLLDDGRLGEGTFRSPCLMLAEGAPKATEEQPAKPAVRWQSLS